MVRWVVASILHGGPIELFLVPTTVPRVAVVCAIRMLLIGKSSPCGGSGFPLSLFEWFFTICLTPYNRKYNVLSGSLKTPLPSFHRLKSISTMTTDNPRAVHITQSVVVCLSSWGLRKNQILHQIKSDGGIVLRCVQQVTSLLTIGDAVSPGLFLSSVLTLSCQGLSSVCDTWHACCIRLWQNVHTEGRKSFI